jgi:beta-galactosidase/beta-glucuronidase
MGEQKLYKSTVEFHGENSEVSTKIDQIGFRTLRLVQDEVFPGEPNKGKKKKIKR